VATVSFLEGITFVWLGPVVELVPLEPELLELELELEAAAMAAGEGRHGGTISVLMLLLTGSTS